MIKFGDFSVKNSHLIFDGCDLTKIAEQFGTPCYVLSLSAMTKAINAYKDVLAKHYPNSMICFASKALSCVGIYTIANELGIGCDVVSGGELYTALKGGMDASKIVMHGNNKLSYELDEAVKCGVHSIVIDNERELEYIDAHAKGQQVSVRVNPGVEAHTHSFIQTARVDSKFGFSIADGSALDIIKKIKSCKNVKFIGLHCHIGSQIFEEEPFKVAARTLCGFVKTLNDEGIQVEELNLGGGFGIHYVDSDVVTPPAEQLEKVLAEIKSSAKELGIKEPRIVIEPGRSIVGEAGVTLYTVGNIKDIKEVKKYVAIDGGMFDNPRFALYQAEYTAVLANRADEEATEVVTVSGKCCESGDIIIERASLPKAKSGDIMAVFSTGAYNYSMASNYNRNLIPPTVLISEGKAEYLVKPQSYEDLVRNDSVPSFIKKKGDY